MRESAHEAEALVETMGVRARVVALGLFILAIAFSSGIEAAMVRLLGRVPSLRSGAPHVSLRNSEMRQFPVTLGERFRAIPAFVIGETPDGLFSQLIIDQGQRDGVRVGDALTDSDGLYLGRVLAVREESSVFAYLTSELHKVTVRVVNEARPLGILRGQGQSPPIVEYLDKNIAIVPDTAVVTSEREQNIPAKLVIGKISHVKSDPTGTFQQSLISVPVLFESIEQVFVITQRML